MALYDTADLLSRCRSHLNRPDTDEALADAIVYAFLTEAQARWYERIAVHAPWALYGAPELLTTSDGGQTYDFASTPFPGGEIELRESRTGRLLRIGAEWDSAADFTWEGDKLRVPDGRSTTFSAGPYARYIPAPDAIDASTEPTLKPSQARILLVYHACALAAGRIGHMDPAHFWDLEQRTAYGDPRSPADVGVIGALKKQVFGQSAGEADAYHAGWWRFISPGYTTT